jgi:hypothetical protein
MAAGSFILPLLPDIIDFEVNNTVEGQVNNTAPTGVVLLDTDLNQINPVSITQISNYFEIVIATGSIVPAIIEINGVAFKTVDPGDTLDILIENSDLVSVGTPDSINNRVDIADSTLLIQKSDSTLIFSFDIAAEDLDFYNVADSVITNAAVSPTYTANVKATEGLILPDQTIEVNTVNEGSIPSVGTIEIDITDGVNPVTPNDVTIVGRKVTVEVPTSAPPSTGTFLVRFFDIDGTILKEERRNAGQDATAPPNPNYDPTYLVFAEWNQPFTNVQNDIDVGAIYDTIDGKTYLFVRITDTTGLQPTLALNKTGTALLTVDWGDSTTSTSSTNGNFTLTKAAAYAAIGDYVITIESTDLYQNTLNTGNIFNASTIYNKTLLKFYMGINMRFQNGGAFNGCQSLRIASVNRNSWGNSLFAGCTALIHCNVATIAIELSNSFNGCHSLKSVSIPSTSTSYNGAFGNAYSLESVIITGANSFGSNGPFINCNSLKTIIIPNAVTNIVQNSFQGCNSLEEIKIGNATTTLGNFAFNACNALVEIEFPNTLTTMGNQLFASNNSTLEYTFLSTTPPTLAATNSFNGINAACKIYVPDASVAAYKAATNWSTYANYIYPLSTKP